MLSQDPIFNTPKDISLSDPNFIPDSSSTVYIIFMIIGIIGYFYHTYGDWTIQAGGAGNFVRNINQTTTKTGNK
jgi:hypothetical protein